MGNDKRVAVTGVIITVSRVFDSITDPVCAFIVEHFSPKMGKIRTFHAFATTGKGTRLDHGGQIRQFVSAIRSRRNRASL